MICNQPSDLVLQLAYLSLVACIPFVQDSPICVCWPDVVVNRALFTLTPVPVWTIRHVVSTVSGDEEVNRPNLLRKPDSKLRLCYSWSLRLFSRMFIWWNCILVGTETIHQGEQYRQCLQQSETTISRVTLVTTFPDCM